MMTHWPAPSKPWRVCQWRDGEYAGICGGYHARWATEAEAEEIARRWASDHRLRSYPGLPDYRAMKFDGAGYFASTP